MFQFKSCNEENTISFANKLASQLNIGDIIIEIPKEVVSERTIKAQIKEINTEFIIYEDCQNEDGTINYGTYKNIKYIMKELIEKKSLLSLC